MTDRQRRAKPPASQARVRCPICGAPPLPSYRPFCSSRCANVDLSRWLRGAYAIPGEPVDAAPFEPEEADDGDAAGQVPRREL